MKLSKPYHIKDFKFLLVLSVLALSVIGALAVGSAEPSAQFKQIIGIILGVIAMLVISMIDYEWILNFYWLIYGLNLLLLLYVQFFGMELNGAKRWIDLKFTTLQPSDSVSYTHLNWNRSRCPEFSRNFHCKFWRRDNGIVCASSGRYGFK